MPKNLCTLSDDSAISQLHVVREISPRLFSEIDGPFVSKILINFASYVFHEETS